MKVLVYVVSCITKEPKDLTIEVPKYFEELSYDIQEEIIQEIIGKVFEIGGWDIL